MTYIIGQNTLNGRPVYLDEMAFKSHKLVLGGTGRGKSKLIENEIRYHLRAGNGLILLDPHGFLYDDILAYATIAGYKDRVILINANETKNSVGLNFLAKNSMDASAHAEQIIRAIDKVFGATGEETKPRLERWMRNLLIALIEARLTLADALEFLFTSNLDYRQAVLQYIGNEYVRMEWEAFDAISKRNEKETILEAPLNRAAKLILSDPIRRMVGQQRSTIDIGSAIEHGKIILVNLAPVKVSRECQQVSGILLVDQIINYAFQRPKKNVKKPFFVYIDEADELSSNDLPYSLQSLRKFGIFFTLCYQTLAQIEKIPGYYEGVMANCDVKIAFKSSRIDAERLIGELFAGHIRGDKIKDEIYHTIQIPKETVREVINTGYSKSETRGEVDSIGDSYGEGSGTGNVSSSGSGFAEHFIPGDGLFNRDILNSRSHSESSAAALSQFSTQSSGSFSGLSRVSSQSSSESKSTSIVPFYEYIREQELSNRQYYSIEEIKEKYISWIMCQPQRHAQIKIRDEKAIPIITTLVEEVRVREMDKEETVAISNKKYALPAKEVDRLIANRRIALLERNNQDIRQKEMEYENERWQ